VRVTGPGQPVHLLLDIVDILNDLQIPYALAGALAVSFYGTPRSTNDASVIAWLEQSGKTKRDLEDSLAAANYWVLARPGDLDDPISDVVAVADDHGNRMDLLLGVRGMPSEATRRARTASILGAPLRIVGAEDLVAMKLFAGGVQDLEDVRGVLAVSGQDLDLSLLADISAQYGQDVSEKLNAILNEPHA